MPQSIIDTFSRIAQSNTRNNLETCGVLGARLALNELTISTLVIPKQTSTSDTVAMLNEEEIIDAIEGGDSQLVIGWIHTHPRQHCFMSSVDLHTHVSYQLLLAEAIAIVIAPTQTPKYPLRILPSDGPPRRRTLACRAHPCRCINALAMLAR